MPTRERDGARGELVVGGGGRTAAATAVQRDRTVRRRRRRPRRRFRCSVVRRQTAGHRGQRRGRARGRGHRLVSVVREHDAGADDPAHRQSGVHIRAVRGGHSGRSAHHQGRWPPAAAGHDVGRDRPA